MVKTAAGLVIYRKISGTIQYLLLQTSYGIHHWTPPKGHADPGETELETAYRETEEESSILKSDLKLHENISKVLMYNVNNKPKKVVYWLAELINPNSEVKLSDEHQDFKWLPLSEACEFSEYPSTKELFKEFDECIRTHNL